MLCSMQRPVFDCARIRRMLESSPPVKSNLAEVGLEIPEHLLSTLLLSGNDLDAYMRVPLTSIIQPMAEIGRQGASILLDLIARRFSGVRQVTLPVSLMIRRSSGAEGNNIALVQPSREDLQSIS